MSTSTQTLPQQLTSTPAVEHRVPKLIHLQVLRAMAASLVVVGHTCDALVWRKLPYVPAQAVPLLTGVTGVGTFFIVSGFIMLYQSADSFGSAANAKLFAFRRIERILPMYWIATVAWVASLIHWKIGTPKLAYKLLLSLYFIPNIFAHDNHLSPVLAQGWTLNYEMAFYLLFALALLLPRKTGIAMLVAVPVLATLVGLIFAGPPRSVHAAVFHFYTNRQVFLFAAGVLLALFSLWRKPAAIRFPISPAFLVLAPPILLHMFPSIVITQTVWLLTVAYCAVVVAICSIRSAPALGWIDRALVLLGDASFCTYLFHVWVFGWCIPYVIAAYANLHREIHSATPFVIVCVIAANLLGLLLHLAIERPIYLALRNRRRRMAASAV